jgi:hypothetical protein
MFAVTNWKSDENLASDQKNKEKNTSPIWHILSGNIWGKQ